MPYVPEEQMAQLMLICSLMSEFIRIVQAINDGPNPILERSPVSSAVNTCFNAPVSTTSEWSQIGSEPYTNVSGFNTSGSSQAIPESFPNNDSESRRTPGFLFNEFLTEYPSSTFPGETQLDDWPLAYCDAYENTRAPSHNIPNVLEVESDFLNTPTPPEYESPGDLQEGPVGPHQAVQVEPTPSPGHVAVTQNVHRSNFRDQNNQVSLVERLYIQERHTLSDTVNILERTYFNVPRQRTLKRWLNRRGVRKYTNGNPRRSRRSTPSG